jgi:biopolymer transport protein ExbB
VLPSVEFINRGGPTAWVILACGALALGVFIERALHLHKARIRADDFLRGIMNILGRGNVDEALTIADETSGPVAQLARVAILHRRYPNEEMRAKLNETIAAETSRMERRLIVIATIAQIAPMLGLLGTVLGLLNSLRNVETTLPFVLWADATSGLYMALINTAMGLIVAIPCYAGFNMLVIKIDRLILDMDRASSELVTFLTQPEVIRKEKP